MKEVKGKHGTAKIFTDLVEPEAIEQISTLLDQEFVGGSKIRIMPDVHAGAGCTIGTTMTIKDKVCPNLVGVDIGCGMLVAELADKEIDLEMLDRVIREYIPSGRNIRDVEDPHAKWTDIDLLHCRDHVNIDRARLSIGTLGGGNHFIEVDRDDDGKLYLIIHSGSRHLGTEVAKYYQHLAEEQLCGRDKTSRQELINSLKAQGRHSEIAAELKKLESATTTVQKDLAYLTREAFEDYIRDMMIVQKYATYNRLAMLRTILFQMNLRSPHQFETVHNYIDDYDHILRKGAVSAHSCEQLLIPINMRDGSLLCLGKGNPDWNYSAPHGAGRLMSRSKAKQTFTVEEFSKSMDGIYTTSVGDDTLDECPMAYKPIDSIINNIGDTVEIQKILRPIYNFKAGEK